MRKQVFIHNEKDNVAVAISNLKAGSFVEIEIRGEPCKIRLLEDIDYGHKVSIRDLERGSKVTKYGEVIGEATKDIPCGAHVHIHNIKSLRY